MDNPTRLKLKIGDHEFEAGGPADTVNNQFLAWRELVQLAATAPVKPAQPNPEALVVATEPPKQDITTLDSRLDKIMRVEDRIVSLTARLSNVHDAVLVMLYGQKVIRGNDAVTGAELISGLEATGGYAWNRLDRILDKLATDGDVMSFGERRGKKYRLTNAGGAKARALITDLLATVG